MDLGNAYFVVGWKMMSRRFDPFSTTQLIRYSACVVGLLLFAGAPSEVMAQAGVVEIDFLDAETDQPLPCRVQILDSQGRYQRARGSLFDGQWNLVTEALFYRGRPGDYRYRVAHGPQFSPGNGQFTLDKNSEGYDAVRLERHCDLEQEGWVGGDLLVHTSEKNALAWMPAEDLQMSAVVGSKIASGGLAETTRDGASRWVETGAYYDDRSGSGIVTHHWLPPAAVPDDLPSTRLLVMSKQASEAGQPRVHNEIQKLWALDVPIWLASARVDSIQLLSSHLTPDGKGERIRFIVDPAPERFSGRTQAARKVEAIYWKVLEAGLHIPPTAGSGYGQAQPKLRTHVGYNRIYASVASGSTEDWWQAVRQGRSFVTNGPLLRATVNGQPPGTVFESADDPIELSVALTLTVSDPVDYLDVIFNEETLYQARLDEHAKRGGRIPPLTVDESGWMVIRVVTAVDETYRIACTAPFYFQIGDRPRVSVAAVQFFQDWLEEAEEAYQGRPNADQQKVYVEAAKRFWESRAQMATVP